MCGITGWIDWDLDLTRHVGTLEAMTATLASRGPDAAGTWVSPRAAFGHRRLIVIDPEGGLQPMVRSVGERTYALTYNGELYNTAELRRELESRGHAFLTRCDTEVVLLAYVEWGPECVERLNGIFAFGVWESAEQRLFLARDRLGVKPLFYTHLGTGGEGSRGTGLLFASELKALLAHPGVPAEIDGEGLAEVLVLGPLRTPGLGVFRGLRELRPGWWLLHDRGGTRLHRYWELRSRPHEQGLDATAATVRELLQDTVVRQLVSDVPVCTLLSGGLDSSAVTAIAAEQYAREGRGPLRTLSVDFVDNERHFQRTLYYSDPDAPWAHRISRFLGTRHSEVRLDTPEVVEALVAATRARDLPGMADVDSSLLLFCREIKREATVALSGEAADEVFGGYPWFHNPAARSAGTFPWVRMVRERAALLSPDVRRAVRAEAYAAERYHEALGEVPRLPGEPAEEARVRDLFYLNITRFMPILLDRKDRMSMAAGLEVRVPYCDHRLVQYVWNIPWSMKCCDGQAKGILRRALAGLLPEDALARKKSPYPKTQNPAFLQATRDWVLRILADPASPLTPLLDARAVREVAEKPEPGLGSTWFSQTMGDAQYFAYLAQVDTWLRQNRVRVV
jgi:asparagine synthase (glutamine-hydrolysing)